MNIEQLREELKEDEGCKYEVYLDHLGLPTHGIGHLITEWDEEYEKPVGTPVSEERVNNCFQSDVHVTIDECKKLYDTFDDLPEEVQLILCNMMFNMGRPRLSKFVLFRKAVKDRDWIECGYQLKNSRYYTQVTARADRLIARLQAIQSQ